jgi:hypothetical protein
MEAVLCSAQKGLQERLSEWQQERMLEKQKTPTTLLKEYDS